MPYGYNGQILRVNLSQGITSTDVLEVSPVLTLEAGRLAKGALAPWSCL